MRLVTDILADFEEGAVLDEINGVLDEIVRQVERTGRVGKLKIEMTIRPNGEGRVTITPSVKPSIPEPSRAAAMYYVSEGGLMRRNPNQHDLPLRSVESMKDVK